jgi:ornithine carbamoyltransferase
MKGVIDMDLLNYKPEKEFSQKHLLRLSDYSTDEILQVLSLALKLKKQMEEGQRPPLLAGKILAMIFAKSSARTRVSFDAGIYQLGGIAQFINANEVKIGVRETVSDLAKVLSRMVDGIMIRTFAQSDVEDLAKYGSIPVINGLTDLLHPCQILADLMTYYEHTGSFEGKLAFLGDGNNVANSLLIGCSKLGLNISIACPAGFEPDGGVLAEAKKAAALSGSEIVITHDPKEAAKGASAVYTDVWASMGQEAQAEEKHKHLEGYQVNEELMSLCEKDAVFLHCLPAHRGEEVTEAVIDGKQSVVFDEAENRLHAQKAVMVMLMQDK